MPIKGKLVLVIDDASEVRSLIRKILEGQGLNVKEAASAHQAFEAAQATVPQLIIVDLRMPEKSGFSFLEEKKEYPSLQSVPVIVVTGLRDKDSMFNAVQLGAKDYIIKPFTPVTLIQKVRKQLISTDFLRYTLSKEERATVSISVPAQINRIGETGFFLDSIVRLGARTTVKVHSDFLDKMNLSDLVFLTAETPGKRSLSGEYLNRINVLGLTGSLTRKLRVSHREK